MIKYRCYETNNDNAYVDIYDNDEYKGRIVYSIKKSLISDSFKDGDLFNINKATNEFLKDIDLVKSNHYKIEFNNYIFYFDHKYKTIYDLLIYDKRKKYMN